MISATPFVAAAAQNDQGALSYLIFLLPVLMLGWLWWTTRRRQREAATRAEALQPGQRILTASGIIGTLVSRGGGIAQVEVADGVVLTLDERALMGEAPAAGGATTTRAEGTD